MSAVASGRIFISYRRQESSGMAGRLYDRLAGQFGQDQVFMDVDTIALGADFAQVITEAVRSCEVLLAVIGPRWLEATDQNGRRRLEDPDDIVQLEITAALERDIRVIPILVEGAQMPRRNELPENLAGLARRNALSLRHESFPSDADRLLAAIEPLLRPPTSEAPVVSGPARVGTPPTTATRTEPTAAASTAETTTSASARSDTGWSSTRVHTFEQSSKWGLLGSKMVFGVAFSPDGRWLATCSIDKTARIWDAHSGGQLRTLSHDNSVWAVAFSPDGRWLATGSKDNKARIWDAHSGQQVHVLGHEHFVKAVAFSPDGRWLATGSRDKTARIWETHSGQQLRTFSHDNDVRAVGFSPDGRWLATGPADNTARIWDAHSGQQLRSLKHPNSVQAVAFSPDGRWLATGADVGGSGDPTARIWDARGGQLLYTLGGIYTAVEAVAFSPDGRWLATGGGKTVRIHDAPSRQLLHTISHDNQVWAVAFSPDGHRLAAGTAGNRAVLWALTPPPH